MDTSEKELLEIAIKSDAQIKRLYDQHRLLDRKIQTITGRGILTGREELEVKVLKKQKLLGKDNLMRMLSEFRVRMIPRSRMN